MGSIGVLSAEKQATIGGHVVYRQATRPEVPDPDLLLRGWVERGWERKQRRHFELKWCTGDLSHVQSDQQKPHWRLAFRVGEDLLTEWVGDEPLGILVRDALAYIRELYA